MPICHDGYMGTAPDLSGSISKNRFRNELFWGIDRLLTCLDSGIDSFAVVFDYRCDIELHLDDRYEFYQVKTGGKGTFGVTWATRLPKRGISIIARLYELDDASQDCPIKLVIVGNRPFVKRAVHSIHQEKFCLRPLNPRINKRSNRLSRATTKG